MINNLNQPTSYEEATFIMKVEGETMKNLDECIKDNSFKHLHQQHNYNDQDEFNDIDFIDDDDNEIVELITREVFSLAHLYSYIVNHTLKNSYNQIELIINNLVNHYRVKYS